MERAKWMAGLAGSKVSLVDGSHAVLISQPSAATAVIETAARSMR